MKNLVLTVTLRADSDAESELVEHFNRFKTGKGFQDRSFELRRLLIAGLDSHKSFSEIPGVRSQAIKKNAFVSSSPKPSVYSSNSIEDVYQDSSNQFTVEAVSGIPEISLSEQVEKVRESINVIAVIEVDTKINVEQQTQQTQQNLAVLSISSESVNAENSDPNSSAEMLASVAAWDFGMAKQAENTNVTTGEIT